MSPSPARKVLVVDDNTDSAEALALLLRLGGADVRMAHDGMQALAVAEQARPDIVFLDIGLPGLSGHQVAARIRALPWGAEVVLVALTGWGGADDLRRSREAGFDHHLVKPVQPDAMLALVASLPGRG